MAHFVQIDCNRVISVIVISNDDINNTEFPESEALGQAFIRDCVGLRGDWLQTSRNTRHGYHPQGRGFRMNYAGINSEYLPDLDAFRPPRPYDSWIFDPAVCDWRAPVDPPEIDAQQGDNLCWDETNQQWLVVRLPT